MASTDESKGIQIGDRVVNIDTITGWKFLECAQIISELTEKLPRLYQQMDEFRRKRIEQDTRTYNKAQALAMFSEQLADRITDEDWAKLEMDGGLTLPGNPPTQQEMVAEVFPTALKDGRPLVGRLLAVLAIPNGELEAAAAPGGAGLDQAIADWESKLLFTGSVSSLIRLVVRGVEAFRAEATGDPEVAAMVGKLGGLLQMADGAGQEAQAEVAPVENDGSQNSTSSSSVPPSSDGTPDSPSTGTTGESSEDSQPVSADAG